MPFNIKEFTLTNFWLLMVGASMVVAQPNRTNFCPQFSPQCECPRQDVLLCKNFTSLSQLKFERINQTNLTRISYFYIEPINTISFNASLDLGNLANFANYVEVGLSNFNGFTLDVNPFAKLGLLTNSRFNLNINNSVIQFFLFNDVKQVLNESQCNSSLIRLESIFASFDRVTMHSSNKYPTKQCIKIFSNAFVSSLIVFNQDPNNYFGFFNTVSNSTDIYKIKSFYIYNSLINLDSVIFNKALFKSVESIYVFRSNVNRYEKGLFSEFKLLKILSLDLLNFKQFIQSENVNSMIGKDLNKDINEIGYQNLTLYDIQASKNKQFVIVLQDSLMEYEFTDADFCLFKDWPHQRLVYPAIVTKACLKCSCSLMWLVQYQDLYYDKERLITNSTSDCMPANKTQYTQQLISNCNFEQRIATCNKEPTNENNSTNQSNIRRIYLSELELGLIIGLPALFFLLLIVLILIFYAYRQKKLIRESDRVFKL
jgi:hypothetical protein